MSASPNRSNILRRTIDLNYANKKRAKSLKWSVINGLFFLLFTYDLTSKCPGYTSFLHYVEYILVGVLGANMLQHVWQLLPPHVDPVTLTTQQQRLLGLSSTDLDSSFRIVDNTVNSASELSLSNSSDELSMSLSSARQWRPSGSSSSPSSSPPSPPRGSPPSPSIAAPRPPHDEFIADRNTLHDYLKQYSDRSRLQDTGAGVFEGNALGMGGVAGWWGPAPVMSPPHYHLATLDTENSEEGSPKGSPQVWWRLHLDPRRLTQFNLNLRLWIQVTILERLVREMDSIDEALAKHGFTDVRVGQVTVDRLRKTAQSGVSGCESLPALITFLEPFSDQQYVVQRIRELSQGGCLSNYKWNAGGTEWSVSGSKPTDAELLLSLFASYLDSQLPAAPPARRAFTSQHVCAGPSARPPRDPSALLVHRVATHPPHYVLVLGEETLEVARGRNNLLHTLLLLLAACARSAPDEGGAARTPALHRVHLGPAGLNMLWIIGR